MLLIAAGGRAKFLHISVAKFCRNITLLGWLYPWRLPLHDHQRHNHRDPSHSGSRRVTVTAPSLWSLGAASSEKESPCDVRSLRPRDIHVSDRDEPTCQGGSWRAHLRSLGRPSSNDGVRPVCFIMSFLASHLRCHAVLRGSLGTWCEVPTWQVSGRWVESQMFQRRISWFANSMSKGAVCRAATACNARVLRESSQVKDMVRFFGFVMKLLASQLLQPAQSHACPTPPPGASSFQHELSIFAVAAHAPRFTGQLVARTIACLWRWRARYFSGGCCALQRL